MTDKQLTHPDDPRPGQSMDASLLRSAFESLNMNEHDDDKLRPKFKLNEPVFSANNIPFQSHLSCDDNDTSFVVLGKSSLDFINTTSLADYEEIKKKSMAVDYNSIISTLSQEEIEIKVTELLQENVKLKETLSQNNRAMKQHFNTLVSWQNELMKVHGNHKQKFSETRSLVVSLQKENNDLKTRLASTESMTDSKLSGELIGFEINQAATEPTVKAILQDEGSINSAVNADVSILQSIDNTPKVSIDSNINRAIGISSKYEDVKQEIMANMIQTHEIVALTKDSVEKINELPTLNFTLDSISDVPDNPNGQQFFENYKYYNEKLSILTKCYADQTARLANVEDCLKRCIAALEIFEINESLNMSNETQKCKTTLEQYRTQLVNEQLQYIPERQNLIQAHNHFQKIFSDYNTALIELETMRQESIKTAEMESELEKEKKKLTMEEKRLMAEKENLSQEITSLEEKRVSLDSQGLLYEAHMKSLQDNMKLLQQHNHGLVAENTELKDVIRLKDIELEGIRARLQLTQDDSTMNELLQQQLTLWKSDFEEEQKINIQLKGEREDLTNQLRTLRNHNQQLLCRLNGPNPSDRQNVSGDTSDPFCSFCGSFKTPGQWHGPGFCQPID